MQVFKVDTDNICNQRDGLKMEKSRVTGEYICMYSLYIGVRRRRRFRDVPFERVDEVICADVCSPDGGKISPTTFQTKFKTHPTQSRQSSASANIRKYCAEKLI